jgi:plasmid stabilization system protein ParE
MRKYKVAISGEARRMLTEHVFFLARVNPAAAEKLKNRILESIRSLETMPERYPYLDPDDRRSPYRKMPVPDKHLIIYTVQGDTVFVEYVLDDRQDYSWLF